MGSVFKGLPNAGTQPCWKEILLSNPFQSHQFPVFTGFEGWRGTEDNKTLSSLLPSGLFLIACTKLHLLHFAFSFAPSLDCPPPSICQLSPDAYVLLSMAGYDSLLLVHFLTYQFLSSVQTRTVLIVPPLMPKETKADSEHGLDWNILPSLYSYFGTGILLLYCFSCLPSDRCF